MGIFIILRKHTSLEGGGGGPEESRVESLNLYPIKREDHRGHIYIKD